MHTPPSAATGERCYVLETRLCFSLAWPQGPAHLCPRRPHKLASRGESLCKRAPLTHFRPPSNVHSQGAHGTTEGRPADLVPAPVPGNSLLGWLTGMQGGSGDVCGAEVTSPRPHPKTNPKLTSPLPHLPGELRPFSPLPTLVQRSLRVGAEI